MLTGASGTEHSWLTLHILVLQHDMRTSVQPACQAAVLLKVPVTCTINTVPFYAAMHEHAPTGAHMAGTSMAEREGQQVVSQMQRLRDARMINICACNAEPRWPLRGSEEIGGDRVPCRLDSPWLY